MDNYTATEIAYKNGYDKGYEEATNRLQAEIRRYKNCYEQVKWERDLFEEQCKTAEAEAIKEFAERLKEKCISNGMYPAFIKASIYNLVKEMVGDA